MIYFDMSKGLVELHVLPVLTGCGLIIVWMIVWYGITDRIEKAHLKRINEKLSQNRPQ